jgi:dephospho-CoA kinase
MSLPALILLAGTSEAGKSTAGTHLANRGATRVKIRTILLDLTTGRLVTHENVTTREGFEPAEFLARLHHIAATTTEEVLVVESFIDADLARTTRSAWPSPCRIVFVTADRRLRVHRQAHARGITDDRSAAVIDAKDLRKRVTDQWHTWRRIADVWIDNDHAVQDLHDALDAVVASLDTTSHGDRHA